MALTKATFSMVENAWVNVRDFGAKGDGVTDDTAAIQAALDYVATVSINIGGTVYVPAGQYLIKAPLGITLGTTIQGERSGLTGVLPNLSTGTVFQVAARKADGTQWTTSQLNGPNTVSGRVLFYMKGGGGVVGMHDFAAIPDNSITSDAIFFQTGQQNPPFELNGVSQGFFVGLRIVAFNYGFKGSAFNDCNFVNCGWEFNLVNFQITSKADGSNGSMSEGRFTNCVFFGQFVSFQVNAATMKLVMFSNCDFLVGAGLNAAANFQITDNAAIFEDITIVGCQSDFAFASGGNKNFFRVQAASPTINNIVVNGCVLIDSSTDINYIVPAGTFKNIIFNGNVFNNSAIRIQYELASTNISNNMFVNDSYVELTGGDGLVINGNNFTNATGTKDIDLSAAPVTNLVANGNLCRSGAGKGIPMHPGSTLYKICCNLNVGDSSNP